ncbi:hypothetical protein CC86DRAFT_366729 [Ophiobolus disseminans]|uniref:Uncharacterized protein n=1 Tax=Ophiobolus disseminans TaxID=1469910 RepID=A0A6A7ADW0_9PLEO|nr:hypothetical protein CC86DRAFT_366729 [Ophiobolus disseminans]
MYIKSSTLFAGAFALCAFAAPLPDCDEDTTSPGTSNAITKETLIAIEPKTASCAASPKFPGECADAARAAPAINKAFETYKITSKGEQAALIAYMLFESGNFTYNRNHFPEPGRPGQGSRMMAMPPFIKKYATAVAGAEAVAKAEAAGGDAGLNAVLELVISDDEKSFGSAPWFLTSTCTPEVRKGLEAETVDGWHDFLTKCVETTAAPERDPLWTAAKKALNSGN